MSNSSKQGNVNETPTNSVVIGDSMKSSEATIIPSKKIIDKPLLCFCMVNFLLNAAISVITPFYPPMAKDAGLSVSMISYVFAIQPVGSFLFSFFMSKKMSIWGRKKCMVIGQVIQCITITSFGFLELVDDNYTVFLTISLSMRFFQGASRAAYASISFAYVPILWPTTIQRKISIMESLTGLGLMSGPFMGAVMYKLLGYQWVFYIMGILFSLSLIPTILYLPSDNSSRAENQVLFNRRTVFSNIKVIALGLVVTMTSAGTTFINPVFSIHMQTFGIDETQSSLLLVSLTIAYVTFINIVPKLLKTFDKKIILTVGLLLSALGDLIIAPIQFLPSEWWLVLIGLPIIGVANALCVLPSIPQFIEFMTKIFPGPEHRRQITDMSSALFVGSYSFGVLVGPLLGGWIYEYFLKDPNTDKDQQVAFRWASTLIGLLQVMLAVFFFVVTQSHKVLCRFGQSHIREPLVSTPPSIPQNSGSLYSDRVYTDHGASEYGTDSKALSYDN